ncbi:mitochondrial import inner membrane translocase subunit Tim29 [Drosophila pseudoobscura]|uniref:Mitochondrial import inner membrane translocase subunit Tim29 n=1 Tax=Drosophila pseudoobscura pseudoobscura TaxID=46245 RepID=A0A6I8VH90_DROPS|nr:mitochondrial import inner membrane translocase subunit Tim29 [Drosophila pseudoobscura]XP_015041323.2 mitochondrial import inner membrane translocase subunit Tim29 [Drosophila pseudoobscura]
MSLMRVGSRVTALGQKIGEKIVLPERFKDTFVEKWVKYWKGLVRDYSEVALGVVKESYTKPKKALAYGTGILCLYQMAQHNPDEGVFMTQLRRDNSRMIMVPPELQNHVSAKHLLMLERAINQKKLRFLSLGICTLVWVDLFSEDDCTYPAICEFTNVGFLNFHERVIDVGFWNEFWRLKWKMHNYDVNYL